MKKPPGGDDNEKESDLWAYVTRDVKPLPGRDKQASPKQKAEAKKPQKRTTGLPPPPASAATEPKSRDIDRRTALRLRRGQMAVEARIDLHGMSRARAHEALLSFLTGCHEKGLRHIMIITGKGTRAAPGVLRQSVPAWLDEPPLRDIVLQYGWAKPRHGGEGALYVLLRRRRG